MNRPTLKQYGWPKISWIVAVTFLITGCKSAEPVENNQQPTINSQQKTENDLDDTADEGQIVETAVIKIPLSGDIAQRSAELSGLAWYGDYLILLPQFPDFNRGEENSRIFALPRADILAILDGEKRGPLEAVEIPFAAPDIWSVIPGYEGFEAIAFDGERAYLTIEASPRSGMIGYLVSGEIAADLSQILIDLEQPVRLPSASGLGNKSDETVLLTGEELLTIHEANGIEVNPQPVAHRFDTGLQRLGTLPFPAVEYRITDATEIDEDGRFWAVNYFFPGEFALGPEVDPIAETYGQGPTHAEMNGVARLLEFQLTESDIILVDQPPVQLELHPLQLHNWEGIVRLEDRGFLMVTDKFPETILGFVPYP